MIDKIIFELLLKDGNETNFIKNYDVYFNFQELIKELVKVVIITNNQSICD